MTIKEYITKNLSSLNWNILPQIFAENGVEMNEEIEAYLRNTPENTNWSILEQLRGSGTNSKDEEMTIYVMDDARYISNSDFESMGLNYTNPEPQEIFAFCEAHNENDIAQNINVMVFNNLSDSPVKSEYDIFKQWDEWYWFNADRYNSGHYFVINENGDWYASWSD